MPFDSYHLTLIVVALITGVISPVVLQITKYFLVKTSSKKTNYKVSSYDEKKIVNKLSTIIEKYNADRSWIAEFHNGEVNYSGKSFQKFSETYEEVSKGTSSEALNTQAIPTSLLLRFFNELKDKGFYFIPDTNNINANDYVGLALESFLQARSIKSFFSAAIKDIQGNFVGLLCLDGVHRGLNLDQKDIQDLTLAAANLAGYLENVES